MKPTPSPVIAGLSLQPVTLAMVDLLREVDSPFVRPGSKPSDFTLVPMMEGMYVMTHPTSEGRAALARGRGAFTNAALATVGTKLTIEDCAVLGSAMQAHVAALTSADLLAASVADEAGKGRNSQPWKLGR